MGHPSSIRKGRKKRVGWDELDQTIIKTIRSGQPNFQGVRELAKRLDQPRSSIQVRVARLIDEGIVIEDKSFPRIDISPQYKFLKVKEGWPENNIHYDEVALNGGSESPHYNKVSRQESWHGAQVRAPILIMPGIWPEAKKEYNPNGWVGRIYDDPLGRGDIRVTPFLVIADITKRLGKGLRAEMSAKYLALGSSMIDNFVLRVRRECDKKFRVGKAVYNREPHKEAAGVESVAVAKALGPGVVRSMELGIQKDDSDEEGEGRIESHSKRGDESLDRLWDGLDAVIGLDYKFDDFLKKFKGVVEAIPPSIADGFKLWYLKEVGRLEAEVGALKSEIVKLRSERAGYGGDPNYG